MSESNLHWTRKVLWQSVELNDLQFAEAPHRSISGSFRPNLDGFTDWPHKTFSEISRDLISAQQCCYIGNQEDLYGIADHILLPPDVFSYISETPAPPFVTILEGLRVSNFGCAMYGFDKRLVEIMQEHTVYIAPAKLPFNIDIRPDPTLRHLAAYVVKFPEAARFTGYWR